MIKRARMQRSETKHATAQTLPASLVLHIMRFLGDALSLTMTQRVCRNWNQFTNHQLDLCWRPLYFKDWEAESTEDGCIMIRGANTSWKQRYERRRHVENNWKHARVQMTHVVDCRNERPVVLTCNTKFIAMGTGFGAIILYDLNGKELRRWRPNDGPVECVKFERHRIASSHANVTEPVIKITDVADGCELQSLPTPGATAHMEFQKDVIVGANTGKMVSVWDLATNKRKSLFHSNDAIESMAVDWSKNVLVTAVGGTYQGLRFYDLQTGELLRTCSSGLWTNRCVVTFDQRSGRLFAGSPLSMNEIDCANYEPMHSELDGFPIPSGALLAARTNNAVALYGTHFFKRVGKHETENGEDRSCVIATFNKLIALRHEILDDWSYCVTGFTILDLAPIV